MVELTGTVVAIVSVMDGLVIVLVSVEVDAWLTKLTVVVTVSTPPACQAGWNTLPSLPVCASVKHIVSGVWMQRPYGWLPGLGVGYS